MPSCLKDDVILVCYPFSDLTSSKVRPAVVISELDRSHDIFITPLTSKTGLLHAGEFILEEWALAGLNVATAVKRGIYTVHEKLIIKVVGQLVEVDAKHLQKSLRGWLGL